MGTGQCESRGFGVGEGSRGKVKTGRKGSEDVEVHRRGQSREWSNNSREMGAGGGGVEEKEQGGWETETKMETGGRVEDTGGSDGGTRPKGRKSARGRGKEWRSLVRVEGGTA